MAKPAEGYWTSFRPGLKDVDINPRSVTAVCLTAMSFWTMANSTATPWGPGKALEEEWANAELTLPDGPGSAAIEWTEFEKYQEASSRVVQDDQTVRLDVLLD